MQYRPMHFTIVDSPVGPLRLIASDKGLRALQFHGGSTSKTDSEMEQNDTDPMLLRAKKQIEEYFAGKRHTFDLKLDLKGTIFQLKAWQELQKIPYGQTISYGEQARRVGDVKKARAVGNANNRNNLPIIIPCHRVVGATGAMVGFAPGVPLKEFLLKHESAAA